MLRTTGTFKQNLVENNTTLRTIDKTVIWVNCDNLTQNIKIIL